MRFIFIIYLLLFFGRTVFSQGIEFNTYETETYPKTSYTVFSEKHPVFHDFFFLEFDLAIHDPGSFGYIFRIKDKKEANPDIFNFVFSYDNDERSYLKFNIEAKENKMEDILDNTSLGPRHWIPVLVQFYLRGDSVTLTIRDKHFVTYKLGLPLSMQPDILFGSSEFSVESPAFAIKNLSVGNENEKYNFPLNESSGEIVHDESKKVVGNTINPIWLINKSYYWNLSYSYSTEKVAGTNYDPSSGEMIIFNKDSLIKVDLARNKTDIATYPPIPMLLRLGTNFYDPTVNRIYIYEVDNHNNSTTAGSLNTQTGDFIPVSDQYLSSQRHHHASHYDNQSGKYYIFGGFGSRKYYNELAMFDTHTGEWQNIPLNGDNIAPRFFASMGSLSENELLLYGGAGNASGDQAVGRIYYYDLYSINTKDGTVKKLWEFGNDQEDFVPVRELIVSDDKKSFYTLCYPMQLASSYLRLFRFSVADGEYTVLGDSIPMESKAILSNANLYYNSHIHEYYCCVQEFQEHGGEPSKISIYSLAAPAISENELLFYVNEKTDFSKIYYLVLILLVSGIVLWVFMRKNNKRQNTTQSVLPSVNLPGDPKITLTENIISQPKKNAVYLFGEFTVYDRSGKDVTYMFSNKTKHLFLLTLLKSLDGSGGITSSYMYGVLWPYKDPKSAKNLKGVFINKLRKVLEEIEGISFTYNNNHYTIELSDDSYCDYKEYIELTNQLKDSNSSDRPLLQDLISILKRGKFLRSMDMEGFDSFKTEADDKLMQLLPYELKKLYENQDYESVVELSEIALIAEPSDDMSLWYLLHALNKLKKEDIAMKKYYLYTADYLKHMGTDYKYSYHDILRCDVRVFLEK